MNESFALDPRLAADSVPVAMLELCELRLMDDARFGWLLLVPRRAGASELWDLDAADQAVLWREVARAAVALRQVFPCDKLNLGALGNIVRQLHVHVLARRVGDDAWPGPAWGSGQPRHYAAGALAQRVHALRAALDRPTD